MPPKNSPPPTAAPPGPRPAISNGATRATSYQKQGPGHEWNDLPEVATRQFGSYQTLPTLDAQFWNLIRFSERDFDGGIVWLMYRHNKMIGK